MVQNRKKNTAKIAIVSFTFPQARQHTMVQNRKKRSINSHLINHFPISLGVSEHRELCGASQRVSGAREQVNGQVSGPVFTSGFLIVLDHSAAAKVRFWLPGITSLSSARQSRIEEKSKESNGREKRAERKGLCRRAHGETKFGEIPLQRSRRMSI